MSTRMCVRTRRDRSLHVAVLCTIVLACVCPARPAAARPRSGGIVRTSDFRPANRWVSAARPDPRAELLIPVNVVRIYSDEHSAERMAPRKWVFTQLEIANRLFRFTDPDMAQYGPGKPAPCIQFRLNKIYDVHEREVSEALGYAFDTEKVYGSPRTTNERPKVGTRDLRTLKVTEGTQYMTVFCVWDLKDPSDESRSWGGESHIGFAQHVPTGPRRTLIRVTATRATMGVVTTRQQYALMNNFAHEFGHYFHLPHAWVHSQNRARGIRDLGTGPQGNVDADRSYANVMDYDRGVHQYYARSQLDYMYRFARRRAPEQIQVVRTKGGGTRPPAPKTAAARVARVWVDRSTPGGQVVVHAEVETENMRSRAGEIVAWFFDGSGQRLQDFDGKYRTADGQVCAAQRCQPPSDRYVYKDFRLALPGEQLHMVPGSHKLSVIVGVISGGKVLTRSTSVGFAYVMPAAPKEDPTGGKPAAWFTSAEANPSVLRQGKPWVRVRATLRLDNLRGQDVQLQSRFHFTDGRALYDFNNQYRSPEGLAFTETRMKPSYVKTIMKNVELWIPVAELHLAAGVHRLAAGLTVVYRGRPLASTCTSDFTAPKGTAPRPSARWARFEKVWLAHNQTVGGKRGLVVHARVTVAGCPRQDVVITAWFYFANGKPLKNFDKLYGTKEGQVSAWRTVRPDYDPALFHDCAIFIPYDQLHMVRGKHDLGVKLGAFHGQTRLDKYKEMTTFEFRQQ